MDIPGPKGIDELTEECDVAVIGGGTAGAVAAIQAARAGASTVVIEMGGQLGGTLTTGGVDYPGLFHAWGRQIIAGIGWELVERTVREAGDSMPDFTATDPPHHRRQIKLCAPLLACLAEEAALDAGVTLHYHELPVAVEPDGGDGWLLAAAGKGVRRRLRCREMIDCTGDADIVALLGFDRIRSDVLQPGTLRTRFGGYDPDALDADEIERRFNAAIESGELRPGDCAAPAGHRVQFLRARGGNCQHTTDIEGSTSPGKSAANVAGRRSILRLLRFVRTLSGCENARLVEMRTETAVRETYRIVGETTVTVDDYLAGRVYDDAICHAFYNVDIHRTEGGFHRPVAEGVVPTVPFSALVPAGSRRLLAAGRCVSSDREANSALRVEAPCMAMGQAAGAAAALAAAGGAASRDVPLADLRRLLAEHGAIVPEA